MIENFSKIKEIKRNGYSLFTNEIILEESDMNKLKSFLKYQFDNDIGLNVKSDTTPVIDDILGRDKEIDKIIEKIILNEVFQKVTSEILGKNFKIWEISSRISIGTDKGLSMHQDAEGQMNFWFILSDQQKPSGVTAFLPKSHLFDRTASKVGWSPIAISRFFLKPLIGKEGNFAFFINKTWHARLPNISGENNFTMAIGMFAEDSSFTGNSVYKSRDLSHIEKIKKYLLFENNNTQNESFCMSIERNNKINIKTFLLNILFFPILIIRKFKNN